jgi:AraC-like DNA-binding protein
MLPLPRWIRYVCSSPRTFRNSLHRHFRQPIGTNPLSWLHEQRLRRAQELLERTARVRDALTGSSSQRHKCPGGSFPGSAGVQAIAWPSANSTTWFSRTSPLVSVIVNTPPAWRKRCPASAAAIGLR